MHSSAFSSIYLGYPGMDLGFPKGGAKLGASMGGGGASKCGNWLIQLVVQCEKYTYHEEYALSRESGDMSSQENFAN